MDSGTPVERWMGANFLGQAEARAKRSSLVCEACVWATSWVPPPDRAEQFSGKRPPCLRQFSHVWTESLGYRSFTMSEAGLLADALTEICEHELAFVAITTAGKQHVLPYARVGVGAMRMVASDVGRCLLSDLLGACALVRPLVESGVRADEIVSGMWSVRSLPLVSRDIEQRLRSWRGSVALGLACFLEDRRWKRTKRERSLATSASSDDTTSQGELIR